MLIIFFFGKDQYDDGERKKMGKNKSKRVEWDEYKSWWPPVQTKTNLINRHVPIISKSQIVPNRKHTHIRSEWHSTMLCDVMWWWWCMCLCLCECACATHQRPNVYNYIKVILFLFCFSRWVWVTCAANIPNGNEKPKCILRIYIFFVFLSNLWSIGLFVSRIASKISTNLFLFIFFFHGKNRISFSKIWCANEMKCATQTSTHKVIFDWKPPHSFDELFFFSSGFYRFVYLRIGKWWD